MNRRLGERFLQTVFTEAPPSFFRRISSSGAAAVFLLLFAGAVPALAAGPQREIRRTAGITRQVRVRMVAQPWSATAAAEPQPAKGARQPRFVGHYPGYAEAKRKANAQLKKLLQSVAREKPLAPAAASTSMVAFDGPNESQTLYIPPDPVIAVGPNDVVVAINDYLAIYDKTGALQGNLQGLPIFFSTFGGYGQIFDPRLVYDQADGRFILSAAEVDMSHFSSGYVLLAVSATSDPTGVWYKYAIDFKGRDLTNTADTFPDFPGLGLSPTAVYLTSNQFDLNSQCISSGACAFSDAWIKVIALPALLSGSSTLSITAFQDVQTASKLPAFGIQPALSYGTPSAEFLVAADFSANPGSRLNLFSITTSGTPTLASADLTVPAFSLPPDAPQPGTGTLIITDDFRTLNAVWINGSLWCGQTVQGSGGLAAARWYQIGLSDLASASLSQSGEVNGSGAAYYPALGAESDGTAFMTFSTSSPTTFASAAYTGRLPADSPGTMRSYAIYGLGTGPYDETMGTRWGDYSGISLDPAGASFWGIAEYAGTPDPHFVTRIGQFTAPPALEVSPGQVDFGGVLVGKSSAAQTLTITNISANAVTLGTASVTGPNAADFSLSSDQCSGVSLAAAQSCTLSVTFTPSQQSAETAILSLAYDGGTLAVSLEGVGVISAVLNLSPISLDFGAVPQQQASASQVVTLTNSGNASAQLSNFMTYGAFTQSNNCGASIAPGASCQITVTFYPTTDLSFQGNLDFNANTQTAIYSVPLTGTGVAIPAALFCPTSLAFGNQLQNATSPPQSVILTNNGGESLTVTGIATSGDFSETNNCPGSLGPRTSCQISVTFTPTALGTRTGTLTVGDDAAGSPQTVPLTGNGSSTTALLLPGTLRSSHPASTLSEARGRLVRAERQLDFEPNVGQFRHGIRYVARVPGYALGVTRSGLVLEMPAKTGPAAHLPVHHEQSSRLVRLQMRLVGGNPNAPVSGTERLRGKANYFFGRDPRAWRTNVPTYARVSIADVYPGINLVYYGNERRLEYDFVVKPGADPDRIRLDFAGATGMRVNRDGDLLLKTASGVMRLLKPVVYQERRNKASGGRRVYRRGRWVVRGKHLAAFDVMQYDRRKTLVIDPVLSFSTYLGGSGGDITYGIAVDGQGNVYVAGATYSTDFPVTSGAFQKSCGTTQNPCKYNGMDAGFVAKLSKDGSTLIYATYLGGTASSEIRAIAVDSAENAYVTGFTNATDFPVTVGAFQTQCVPASGYTNCGTPFVAKLDPTGAALAYSTYLDGTGPPLIQSINLGQAIAVDAAGDAYVAGETESPDFPTTAGSFEPNDPMPGQWHGFLTALNPAGSAPVFSTYLGGTRHGSITGIALDSSGNAYVTGATFSLDFPTTPGAFQSGLYAGPSAFSDNQNAFVAKFSSSGSLLYSTYLGGLGASFGTSIAIDSTGAAYVAGANSNGDFPVTAGAFESVPASYSAFVTKLHPAGCALLYSTFLGPQQPAITTTGAGPIAVDSSGDAYVAGSYYSASYGSTYPSSDYFPVVNAMQPSLAAASGFVTELNPAGSALLFSTPFGGSMGASINALALDPQGDIYLAGSTSSPDLPIANALEPACASCASTFNPGESFVTKISPVAAPGVSLTRPSLNFQNLPVGVSSQSESVGLMNNQSVALNIQSVAVSGAAFSSFTSSLPCSGSIAPGTGCIIEANFIPTAVGTQTGTITITDDGPGSPRSIALTGNGVVDFSLAAQPQQSMPPVVGTDSLSYLVSLQLASGVNQFSDNVALSCANVAPATCTFNPTSIGSGSDSTLTLGNLSGMSGSLSPEIVATDNGQTVTLPLQIAFSDFSLSAGTTSSATVTAGQDASYQISVAPVNGFNDGVSFSCSGLPEYASCQFSPSSLTLDGQTTSKVTVSISTTARSVTPPGSPRLWPGLPLIPVGLWVLALGILLFLGPLSAQLRRRKIWLPVLLALALAATISCGGGGGGTSGSSAGSGGSVTGTLAGTYSVTVTGTSGPDSHAVKLTLTVQ